ncbi:MAG TPA: hypothetical protein VG652_12260 [Gaiellaceae bacterium]|nr:hypothetical protein [Gaiellaceae bacterium]
MRPRASRLLAPAAGALVLASTALAGTPTHAAFVARANAICAAETAQAIKLQAPTSRATTVTYLAKTIAIIQGARTKTLALAAPRADQALLRAQLKAVANELALFRQAKSAAASNDPGSYQADVSQAKTFHDAAVGFAKKLGLKSCEA